MAELSLIPGLLFLAVYLFVPVYFLVLGFFPSKKEIDLLERFTFSIVFSITFMPLIILVENLFFQLPIDLVVVAGNLAFWIVLGFVVYLARIQKIGIPVFLKNFLHTIDEKEAFPLVPSFSYLKSALNSEPE